MNIIKNINNFQIQFYSVEKKTISHFGKNLLYSDVRTGSPLEFVYFSSETLGHLQHAGAGVLDVGVVTLMDYTDQLVCHLIVWK